MADQFLHQVPQGTDTTILNTDYVLVSRNRVTYRAEIGSAILPRSVSANSGQQLRVLSNGKPGWVTPTITRSNIYTAPSGGAGLNTTLSLGAGNRFDACLGFIIGYGYGSNAGTLTYSSPQIMIAFPGETRIYHVSSLRGTGWAAITTGGAATFVMSSSNSSFKIHSIVGVFA